MSVQDSAQYLKEKRIPELMDEMLKEVIDARPKHPNAMMLEHIKRKTHGSRVLRGMVDVIPSWRSQQVNACIVGGGHAAHVLMALLPSRGIVTRVLATFGNESERINTGIKETGGIKCDFASHLDPSGEVIGVPIKVSKKAEEVIPQSNLIIMPLPSFAYFDALNSIAAHISPGTIIMVTPGQGGFDYIARSVLKERMKDIALVSVQPMPFNCRISDYGKSVSCQQFETEFTVCCTPEYATPAAVHLAKLLFGGRKGSKEEDGGHFMNATLMPLNANIHPQHMYRLLTKEQVYKDAPLFYESMDSVTGQLMEATSAEVSAIAAAVTAATGVLIKVPTIYEYEYISFPNPECKTVDQLFRNSPGYKGFKAPFKLSTSGDVYEPDFTHRYFTEDIPYGLCVWKGIAELCGVKTPTIDTLIMWAQKHMGKEYLVEGHSGMSLGGADLQSTTTPQRFGFTSIKQLLDD